MKSYNNYDKFPKVKSQGTVFCGYQNIINQLNLKKEDKKVVVIDTYPVVDVENIIKNIDKYFDLIIKTDDCLYDNDKVMSIIKDDITDDRIFGYMTNKSLIDVFDKDKLNSKIKEVESANCSVLVIGVGAKLIAKGDVSVHFSIARWESQLRFRKGATNWLVNNPDGDPLTKFKIGYFLEWRIADKHKMKYLNDFDYICDSNIADTPKMITKDEYISALKNVSKQPFRLVPYFDPGVWGGQWMKEVCGLDKTKANFAWCFDCVPEENSMLYQFDNEVIQMPGLDIVLTQGNGLLGDRVQKEFGNEFPIRFDFLDTMGGGNLSLQVHPVKDYINKTFNMAYTQDESYYILDAEDDATVYLGVKENADKEEFFDALNQAQETGKIDVEKYVNKWPAKKHDHFLIPSGTIHCSGQNAMVLEISATPYIFTFKLWDWGRLGLDGKPRPINIKHGKKVIDMTRDTNWVKNNLVGQVDLLETTDTYTQEKTGLHEFEFIETRRHFFTDEVKHNTNGSVNVLNLVEGSEAVVESPTNDFEPFVVHYAETFVIPAQVGDYIIKPTINSKGEKLGTVKAYIREQL